MNTEPNFLVYLAGPIAGCTYGECTDWREGVRRAAPASIHTLSPMRGKQRLKEIEAGSTIKGVYEQNPLTSAKGINTRDFNDVRRADAVFVNFLGAKKVSIGTVMEIAWARAFSKPVVCVMESDNVHRHTMLEYACGYIVETLDEGVEVLATILGTDNQLLK
jgi:nucleoside 2-deoxyribosyltransferase